MEFIKVHEKNLSDSEKLAFSQKCKIFGDDNLKSNPCTVKISISRHRRLLVKNKKFNIPAMCKIFTQQTFDVYNINEKNHLLYPHVDLEIQWNFFYLVTLDKKNTPKYEFYQGRLTHISKTGFVFIDYDLNPHLFHISYVDIVSNETCKYQPGESQPFKNIFVFGYICCHLKRNILEFYVPKKIWLEKIPANKDQNKSVVVHFKDGSTEINSAELSELRSKLIDDQIENESDVYLDLFDYSDYHEKNQSFLDYICYGLDFRVKSQEIENLLNEYVLTR